MKLFYTFCENKRKWLLWLLDFVFDVRFCLMSMCSFFILIPHRQNQEEEVNFTVFNCEFIFPKYLAYEYIYQPICRRKNYSY